MCRYTKKKRIHQNIRRGFKSVCYNMGAFYAEELCVMCVRVCVVCTEN